MSNINELVEESFLKNLGIGAAGAGVGAAAHKYINSPTGQEHLKSVKSGLSNAYNKASSKIGDLFRPKIDKATPVNQNSIESSKSDQKSISTPKREALPTSKQILMSRFGK